MIMMLLQLAEAKLTTTVIQEVQRHLQLLQTANLLQLVEVHQIYNHISLAICGRERHKKEE